MCVCVHVAPIEAFRGRIEWSLSGGSYAEMVALWIVYVPRIEAFRGHS